MSPTARRSQSAALLIAGFIAVLLAAGAAIVLASEQAKAGVWLRHAFEVQADLAAVRNLAVDAQTGQRGYLLTGQEGYLAPFTVARKDLIAALGKLSKDTADDPRQTPLKTELSASITAKLAELQRTIELKRAGHSDAALALVNGNLGQREMTRIRGLLDKMQAEETALLRDRAKDYRLFNGLSQLTLFVSPVLILLLGGFTVRDSRRRFREVQAANMRLNEEAKVRETAESQVRQLQKMEAVGQLTGGIAHDFNNMLAIILGCLDMAHRRLAGNSDERALHYLDSAADGARRAATLTARLLAFSRQQALEPRVLEPNRLVASMSELLHRTLGEAVTIETVRAAGLWRVRADPSQLENAILNLAVNARDALPEGGKLTIETANCDLDAPYVAQHADLALGQYVMISVTDNGAGMAPEVVQRAFDPFFTTKEVGKGTGLGLSQVFGFVKQSGGHVAIYSEPGEGTTVKVYLPRERGDLAPDLGEADQGELPKARPGETILVVEDEDAVRRITVDTLRDLGYTVIHAASGDQALQRLAGETSVDLLFTDVVMPRMNGRQLVERVQAERADIKVIYATGYTRNAIVHHGAVDAGAALLTKPYTLSQLATKIRQTLDG